MSSRHEGLPDSELCRAAIQYAEAVSEPFLFHHVMRSAVFADAIGRQKGLEYDRELLCVSTVLHDLGLTRIAPVEARFEIEGADAARQFLVEKGMSERRIEVAWDAIALHTTAEIPSRKCAEIALCQLGIAADLRIAPLEPVSETVLEDAMRAYPWLDIHIALVTTLVGLYRKNPNAAASNPVADACERRVAGFKRGNLCDRLVDKTARTARVVT